VWGVGDTRLIALDVSAVVAFLRQDATEAYLVAVNLSDEDQEGFAPDPLPGGGPVVFGDGALDVSSGAVHVKLAARGAAIFKVR
jgi:hypothetical protein